MYNEQPASWDGLLGWRSEVHRKKKRKTEGQLECTLISCPLSRHAWPVEHGASDHPGAGQSPPGTPTPLWHPPRAWRPIARVCASSNPHRCDQGNLRVRALLETRGVPLRCTSPVQPDPIKFSSSIVSIRSVFHTKFCLSTQFTSLYFLMISCKTALPSWRSLPLRYTGACFCMAFWSSRHKVAVFNDPFWFQILSSRAIEASPAFAGITTGGLLGLTNSAVVSAACRPKTTRSRSEFAPKRLAP